MERLRKLTKRCGIAAYAGLVLFTWPWMLGAAAYFSPGGPAAGMGLVVAAVAAEAYVVWRWRSMGRHAALHGALFAVALLAWIAVRPSNDRDWLVECAALPTAAIDGDTVTLHNVRNFRYAGGAIAEARYESREYDLAQLRSVDFLMSYFGSEAIAHTFLSFGFDDGEYLAVSAEIRKERGESFAPLPGCFKRYELMYVFGDERDLVGLRLYERKEQVYLYRTNVTPEDARALLRDYIEHANALAETPAFYHTIFNNCTTTILDRMRSFWPPVPFSAEILFNGYADRLAYASGALDRSIDFETLRARSLVNDRMPASAEAENFSAVIRGE